MLIRGAHLFVLSSAMALFGMSIEGAAAHDNRAADRAAVVTVEAVFGEASLDGPRAKRATMSPDGKAAAYLKEDPEAEGVTDLWLADTAGGTPVRLVRGADLAKGPVATSGDAFARRERLRIRDRGVTEYVWSEDGRKILIPAANDLWVIDKSDRVLQRLTEDSEEEIDPRFSPLGDAVSFVRNRNLYILKAGEAKPRALTTDGGGAISWGLAEFVAQEEMRRSSGYWWSPDGRHIAVERVDESGVDVVPRVIIRASGIEVEEQRYPRAGRPNANVELFVIEVSTGRRTKIAAEIGDDRYLARVAWSKDGRTLYFQRQSRDQKVLELMAADPTTGSVRSLVTERSETWVELSDDFFPLSRGGFLWTLERDGYRHIYHFDATGSLVSQVTEGGWPVSAIEGVDEESQIVFFSASKESPLERQLYRVSYAAPAEPVAITTGAGWWRLSMGKNPRAYLGTYSDPSTPPNTGLYTADGKLIRWVERNALDQNHPYWPYLQGLPKPRFGTLTAEDGSTLHYSMAVPSNFDPRQRYPAIVRVYGGPVVQTVRREWSDVTDRLLLDRGYIVFRLDNRGSANRSAAFKSSIAGQLGQVETRDQLLGARFLGSLAYVDPARIGIMGWSYGGFMTLMLLTEPDTPFAAGSAGAAPTDWRLYDTHYAERYLGLPSENAGAYDAVDIVRRAPDLQGRLLLLHGMADDNVTFDNALRVAEALQREGKAFEQMNYPGEAHLLRSEAKLRHLWTTFLEFFHRNLKEHP